MIRVFDLREKPQLLDEVISQNFASWGAMTQLSKPEMMPLFPLDLSPHELPATLVASDDDQYAGCVSLRAVTLGAVKHPEWYLAGVGPWLSNMWVAPAARGRGLAKRLTSAVEQRARSLGYESLYSSTAEPDSLYHQLGFQTVKVTHYFADGLQQPMYLIRKHLSAAC